MARWYWRDGKQYVTLSHRLARYGLENREKQLSDLRLARGTRLHIKAHDPDHHARIVTLRPKSAADLKRWIGIPDGAVAQAQREPNNPPNFVSRTGCYPFVPYPAIHPLPNPELQANLMSYLLRDSSGVTDEGLRPINQWIRSSNLSIIIALFQDIYVDNDAMLVLDSKIHTLFARYIYIGIDGGTIQMQAPLASIDCAGMQSFPGL